MDLLTIRHLRVLLSTALREDGRFWFDERIFPFYATAVSLLAICLEAVWVAARPRSQVREEAHSNSFIARRGGRAIFLLKLSRLVAIVLWSGTVVSSLLLPAVNFNWTVVTQIVTSVYAEILAILIISANARQGMKYSLHLTLIILSWLLVYAYRDIWPLMTFTLRPKDSEEGGILWFKLALAVFAGIVEPLLEPYPYIPTGPIHQEPSPEQTASIFSFLTFLWLEATIWRAYRATHLSADELPPLNDADETRNLVKQSYPIIDPFTGAKPRHLFWGLIRIFRRSLAIQTLMLLINGFATIAVPIGTNRLLHYLETEGKNAVVKPWVWILWMGGGPMVQTLTFQCYLYFATRSLVRLESIITSLVFDHALRIRVKAETGEIETSPGVSGSNPEPTSEGDSTDASRPTSATPESEGEDEGDNETAHSRATTASTAGAASTATSTTAATSGGGQAKGKTTHKDTSAKNAPQSPPNDGKNLTGKINNLVTSDLGNITNGRNFLFILLSVPLEFSLGMVFLYNVLGWSAFVGLAVMVALLPVPTFVATRMQGIQKEVMKATDARVQKVTEVVSVLRMVKLFGWEPKVKESIDEARKTELKYMWKRKMSNLLSNCVNIVVPLVHMIATYTVYTVVMKQTLTASIVFSSMTAFEMIRGQVFRLTFMLPTYINANVSLGRIADFLRKTELLDSFTETPSGAPITDASLVHKTDLGFGHADFSWTSEDDGTLTPSRQTFRLRISDEVLFKRGAFNLIVGPTGSGKTSVLMALLGEMHYIPHGPNSWMNLPREGGVAYAAQESWVLNETIKENILFGAPYNKERYEKVIYQCALTRDLSLFDAGDATEVGEKGITLSGGQKARVTLARAVYSSAQILLLDDVLAALDVHTSRWVVNKCFKGDLLLGRTVLLVTHNVAMASPLAQFVISLRDGQVVSQGTISEVLQTNTVLEEEIKHEEEAIELDVAEDAVTGAVDAADTGAADKKDGKLVVAEEIAVGHVGWDALKIYLHGLGGKYPILFWLQFAFGQGAVELANIIEIWWLGYWAQQYALHSDPSEVHANYYLSIYCVLVGALVMMNIFTQVVWAFATLRASRSIHAQLVSSLLASTFRWLDVTPTARITTRCTQDIQSVDSSLSHNVYSVFSMALSCILKLGVVITFTPFFLLPAVFVIALCAFLGQVYMKAQLSVKREMSTAKAPVLGTFGGAISGLVSIRAYHAQDAFRNVLYDRMNRYVRAARSFYNIYRWVGIRMDLLSQLFSAALAVYLVYGPLSAKPSVVGFTLVQATGLGDLIFWFIILYNEFEVTGNSLERIKQYLDIEHEPALTPAGVPPAYWPASGDLRVEALSARYAPDGPRVLADVSFHAKPGERIGIVGRTGAGKSTLTLALLRCIPTEGAVYFDGFDTRTLNLDALRAHITVIPQVPELLGGTLRHSLDPFAQHDDATLHGALRAAGLYALQDAPGGAGRLTLDTPVAGAGANLSVGQRQIVALARALVRGSRLLVLDEATSAIGALRDGRGDPARAAHRARARRDGAHRRASAAHGHGLRQDHGARRGPPRRVRRAGGAPPRPRRAVQGARRRERGARGAVCAGAGSGPRLIPARFRGGCLDCP